MIMNERTFDNLRLIEIMNHSLNPLRQPLRNSMLYFSPQILEYDSALDIGESLLEFDALVTGTSSNINKDGLLRRPVPTLFLDREEIEAVWCARPLGEHKAVELSGFFRPGLEPVPEGEIRVPGGLEGGFVG
jgi:CDP-glycerol glycerophosphotransferase (TagB/SpsB family)